MPFGIRELLTDEDSDDTVDSTSSSDMNSDDDSEVIIKENMNQKKMKEYIDALIFRTKDGDETLAHLRAELVSKMRFIMTLYDLRECWECDDSSPCKPEKCLKRLTPKFTFDKTSWSQ